MDEVRSLQMRNVRRMPRQQDPRSGPGKRRRLTNDANDHERKQLKYLDYGQTNSEETYAQDVEETLYEEVDMSLLRLEPETFDEVWEDAVEALRQRKSVVLSTKKMVRCVEDILDARFNTAGSEREADLEPLCVPVAHLALALACASNGYRNQAVPSMP
eukprot:scaffold584_cov338-Pavlova_lutheri.AAC.27